MAPFRHRLRVRYNECDPQGVVFNANFLTYADIAITELYREAFGSWQAPMDEHGIDMVVAAANVRFLAPAGFDDELELVIRIARIGDPRPRRWSRSSARTESSLRSRSGTSSLASRVAPNSPSPRRCGRRCSRS